MTTESDGARSAARAELAAVFGSGSSASPLAATDPEFWQFSADFAFGETLAHSSLDRRDRLVYQLAATIAVGAVSEFRALLGGALNVGYPRTLNGLAQVDAAAPA